MSAAGHFPSIGRGEHNDADGCESGKHQHRMHPGRPPLQADRIDRPDQDCSQHPQVADVQAQAAQRRQVSAQDDGGNAEKGKNDAQPFDAMQMLLQEKPRERDGGNRYERVEQHGIGCRCVLQSDVGQRVVAADAENAKNEYRPPPLFQQRPLRAQVRQGQRQYQQQGDGPAPESQCHRRNVGTNGTAEHHVA